MLILIFWEILRVLDSKIADDAGKKGGEFYTPKEVVRLLVGTARRRRFLYDPTCGSGGMLLEASIS